MYPPAFCDVAQALDYMSPQQVRHVLELQRRDRDQSRTPRHVGAICRELGYLSPEQILTVLDGLSLFAH